MANIILLAGFPRSGTTWFANLLNSHESIIYRHEFIGRLGDMLGQTVYDKLRYEHHLNPDEYAETLRLICEANSEVDRPPFFKKAYGLLQYPKLRQLVWLATTLTPKINSIYKRLYTVKDQDATFLLKETITCDKAISAASALKTDKTVFLVRAPQGSIASHLDGIKKGKMKPADIHIKQETYNKLLARDLLPPTLHDWSRFKDISEIEYLSFAWVLFHQTMIENVQSLKCTKVVSYEEAVNNFSQVIPQVFSFLELAVTPSVSSFVNQSLGLEDRTTTLLNVDSSSEYYSVYRSKGFKVDNWKDKLDTSDIDTIDKITKPTQEALAAYF